MKPRRNTGKPATTCLTKAIQTLARARDPARARATRLRHDSSGPDEYSGPGEHSGPDEPGGSAGAGPRGRHGTKPAKARRRHSFWRELPVLIITALVIALLIKTFVVQAFFIPSGSMENTLEINDKILVNKLVYHFRRHPARRHRRV